MVAVAAEEIPEEAVMVKILVGILGTAATGMKMVGSAALVVVVMVVAMMKETIVAAKTIDHTPGMANYKRGTVQATKLMQSALKMYPRQMAIPVPNLPR